MLSTIEGDVGQYLCDPSFHLTTKHHLEVSFIQIDELIIITGSMYR